MSWKKWLKPFIMILYVVIICVCLPFIIREFNNHEANSRKEAWLIGGVFVMGAVPISLWTIVEHVVHYTKPHLQRHIIRILWMVPIYALSAWCAIGFRNKAIYFDTLTECYEAYVIYNFMAFLLSFLKHEYPDFGYIVEQKPQVKHLFPFWCCPTWPMGRKFLNICRHGVLQYTLVRPLMTIIAFICEMAGVYHMNEFRLDGAYVYLNVINNISQIWAMYSLIMFYRCTKSELKPIKPMSKFLCVKFVVFLSFWQSVTLAILSACKVISNVEAWKLTSPQEISTIFQNFFICIEMFVAAIAHHFSFSVADYRQGESDSKIRCCYSCLAMCDVSDVQRDMVDHVNYVGSTVKSKLPFNSSSQAHSFRKQNEETPLIMGGYHSDSDISRYSDTDTQIKTFPQRNKSNKKFDNPNESIDSIGSGLSLMDGNTHDQIATLTSRHQNVGSQSSLNNHLITSTSSVFTLVPLQEGLHESCDAVRTLHLSQPLTDLASYSMDDECLIASDIPSHSAKHA